MSSPEFLRRTALFAATVAVACAGPWVAPTQALSSQLDHTHGPAGPVHAGNTLGWYDHNGLVWREEFVGPKGPHWRVRGRGVVRNQNGMLTLNTTRRGSVSATLIRKAHSVGRWETRLRSKVYGSGGHNFVVKTELIPARPKQQRCGARNIALNSYKQRRNTFSIYARNTPNLEFVAKKRRVGLDRDRWHTFAVEVTEKRISWFFDAHVFRTEKRPKALSGVPLTVRFTMQATGNKRMNLARMQMDWLRHWSLADRNEGSTRAPQTRKRTFRGAC